MEQKVADAIITIDKNLTWITFWLTIYIWSRLFRRRKDND
jgi:hypothetical protein